MFFIFIVIPAKAGIKIFKGQILLICRQKKEWQICIKKKFLKKELFFAFFIIYVIFKINYFNTLIYYYYGKIMTEEEKAEPLCVRVLESILGRLQEDCRKIAGIRSVFGKTILFYSLKNLSV